MQNIRKILIKLLGDFPKKCDLKPKILSKEDKGDYYLEKVTFNADKEEIVPSYVLIPKNIKEKIPALVCIHGHGGFFELGKGKVVGLDTREKIKENGSHYQAIEACKKGFLVIAPDMKCFEERRPSKEERERNPYVTDGWYERLVTMNLILQGKCLQTRYVFDLSRTVDYLLTRKEVDKNRIGAFGVSLGGQQTLFLMSFDKRVKAGVCVCGFSLFKSIIRDNIGHNMAAYIPGMLKYFDMDGVISTIFPRPLLLIAGDNDIIFPIDGVKKAYNIVLKKYKKVKLEDRFKLIVHHDGHSFKKDKREIAFEWLKKWL